jgi:hypothetical protein
LIARKAARAAPVRRASADADNIAEALSTSRWKGTLMPTQKSKRAQRAVKTADDFAADILTFLEAEMLVVPRLDLAAVEVRVRDHELVTSVMLAPVQARAAATLLLAVASAVEAAEEGRP